MSSIVWCPGMTLDCLERLVIEKAYGFYGKNKTATAQSLGISVRTLDNKFEKYEEEKRLEDQRLIDERKNREFQLARHRGVPTNGEPIPQPSTFHDTQTGVRVESVANAATQQPVPVQERPQVQSVLPKQPAYGGTHKRR